MPVIETDPYWYCPDCFDVVKYHKSRRCWTCDMERQRKWVAGKSLPDAAMTRLFPDQGAALAARLLGGLEAMRALARSL